MTDLRRLPYEARLATARDALERSRVLHAARQHRYRQRHPTPCPATKQPCVNGCRRRCPDLTSEQLADYQASTATQLGER